MEDTEDEDDDIEASRPQPARSRNDNNNPSDVPPMSDIDPTESGYSSQASSHAPIYVDDSSNDDAGSDNDYEDPEDDNEALIGSLHDFF